MAYQTGIFQYGTIGADGGGYDDYGFGTDEIYTLPPFKVNENTGNDGTGLNVTYIDPDAQALYGAGLTGGNIFTGGGGGGVVFKAPTDDGGYTNPINIADYKKGLIGPEGYGSGRSEPKLINPPGPLVIPKVEVPIGQQGEVGAGGYTDAVNQSLFTQGLIGPAGYGSGTAPSVGPINPGSSIVPSNSTTVSLPKVEVPIGAGSGGYPLFDDVNINLYNRGLVGPFSDPLNRSLNPNATNPPPQEPDVDPSSATVQVPKVEVPIGTRPVGAGGYSDPDKITLYNQGLIGPANDPRNIDLNPNKRTASPGTVTLPSQITAVDKIPSGVPLTYSGPTLSGGFVGPIANPGGPINLPAVGTSTEKPPANSSTLTYSGPPSGGFVGPIANPGGPINLPAVGTSTEKPPASSSTLTYSGPPSGGFVGPIANPGGPINLPPVTAYIPPAVKSSTLTYSGPPTVFQGPVQNPNPTPSTPAATPAPSSVVPASAPFDPNTINTGVGTYGTNAQTLTTKRDFGKELEETLAALQKNQSGIMGMYGDLYKQFMPKGITDTESSVIDQYKTDLARLQQRQAGVLAPEDIRQSQQAAREAYGARGQVMGRGAIGAEIMGRENIRQQREDQARAGMQASYGNIMNMANLQTGNIFSPIGNLMSNTFNPVSPYASDVYGTNVNAQLAKEIAQKNYDAAVRSAELSGAATKSASNTGFLGDLLKVGGSVKIALACMPGYQCIDTPNGPVPIQDLRGGDYVIGYDNTVKRIEQLCSYVENPETEFLEFTLADGGKITVCGPHKILDIPAREWVVGAEMNGVPIVSIGKVTGVTTSYDLLTDVGGYRIAGVPVNSMIPEMIVQTIKQVLLNHA